MRRGVTLIEMLIVVAIISLMAGLSYPAVSAGLETLRINSARDSVVSFLNSGMNRAERTQRAVEITIAPSENTIVMRSTEAGFERTLELPDGVSIAGVLPPLPAATAAPRRFYLYPGGTVPRLGVELVNRRGARRIVRVDPVTGIAQVEQPEAP